MQNIFFGKRICDAAICFCPVCLPLRSKSGAPKLFRGYFFVTLGCLRAAVVKVKGELLLSLISNHLIRAK